MFIGMIPAVLALAPGFALHAPATVFILALPAPSEPGETPGLVLYLSLFRWPLPSCTGRAAMAAGLVAVTGWQRSGFDDDAFKTLPGIVAAFAAYGIARRLRATRTCQPTR